MGVIYREPIARFPWVIALDGVLIEYRLLGNSRLLTVSNSCSSVLSAKVIALEYDSKVEILFVTDLEYRPLSVDSWMSTLEYRLGCQLLSVDLWVSTLEYRLTSVDSWESTRVLIPEYWILCFDSWVLIIKYRLLNVDPSVSTFDNRLFSIDSWVSKSSFYSNVDTLISALKYRVLTIDL